VVVSLPGEDEQPPPVEPAPSRWWRRPAVIWVGGLAVGAAAVAGYLLS
jgi:hypothetical protein